MLPLTNPNASVATAKTQAQPEPPSLPLQRPMGFFTGVVQAGGPARLFQPQLKAEQQQATVALQQDRFAYQQQQNAARQQQRQQEEQAKQAKAQQEAADKAKKEEQAKEVARATFAKATLPSVLSDTERAKREKELAAMESSIKINAAAAKKAKLTSSPQFGQKTIPLIGSLTPEAQALQDQAAELDDPANIGDADLEEYRQTTPQEFAPLDALRSILKADADTRAKQQDVERNLARAKAIQDGVSDEELDAITGTAPEGKPLGLYEGQAMAGQIERGNAELLQHEASIKRAAEAAAATKQRLDETRARLEQGASGAEFARLHGELMRLEGDHQNQAASFAKAQETYEAKRIAQEQRMKAFNESVARQQAQQALPAATRPAATAPTADTSHAAKVLDATGKEIGKATSQPDTLEALEAQKVNAYWSDPETTTPATPESRAAAAERHTATIAELSKTTAALATGFRAKTEQIAARVRRGELSPQEAEAEQAKEFDRYSSEHQAESAAIGLGLSNALRDFQEGKIDTATLNAVFHASGSERTGVEAFRERLDDLKRQDTATNALVATIIGPKGDGAEDPGLNGQALALANEIYTLRANGNWQRAQAKEAELAAVRGAHQAKLRAELAKQGIDAGEMDAIIARAEIAATRKANPGIMQNIASKGGVMAWGAQKLPFVGGMIEAARLMPYAEVAMKLDRGEEATEAELSMLNEFVRASEQEPTFMAGLIDGVAALPGYVIELGLTSGVASGVRYAGIKGVQAAMKKMVTAEGRKLISTAMTRLAAKQGKTNLGARLASGALQEAVRLPFAAPGRIAEKYVRDQATQGVALSPEEGRLVAVIDRSSRKGAGLRATDAIVDSFIENASERSGKWLGYAVPKGVRESFAKLAAPLKERMLKSAIVRALVKANPGAPTTKVGAILAKANIDSVLVEMGEERVGDAARALWSKLSTGEANYHLPSSKQIAQEFFTFLVPGAKRAFDVNRHFSRLDTALAASDQDTVDHLRGLADHAATAERLNTMLAQQAGPILPGAAEQGPNAPGMAQQQITPDDISAALDLVGDIGISDGVRQTDGIVADLIGRSQAAAEAGNLEQASRLKQLAIQQSRTRNDAADQELLRAVGARQEINALLERADQDQDLADSSQDAEEQALMADSAQRFRQEAARVAAVVKIARGRNDLLSAAETAALSEGSIPYVEEDGAGGYIITNEGKRALSVIAPAAASYVKLSAEQRRAELANASATAMQAETPAAESEASAASQTAGAAPADSGAGTAEGAATATPAVAAPASSSGFAVGDEVTFEQDGKTYTGKIAQNYDGGLHSIQFEGDAPKAAVNGRYTVAGKFLKGKTQGFDAQKWRASVEPVVESKKFTSAYSSARRIINAAAKALEGKGQKFKNGVQIVETGPRAAFVDGALKINLNAWLAINDLRGEALSAEVEKVIQEEWIHAGTVEVRNAKQAAAFWKSLAGTELATGIERAYFADNQGKRKPGFSDAQLGYEAYRMLVQRAIDGQLTETLNIPQGAIAEIRKFLADMVRWMGEQLSKLPASQQAKIERDVAAIKKALGLFEAKSKSPATAPKDTQSQNTPQQEAERLSQKPQGNQKNPSSTNDDSLKSSGKDYSAYSAEQQALLRENDARYESAKRQANAETDSQTRGKLLKAAGMRYAAEFRRVTGKLTAKEQEAKDAYEASNHVGKAVSVDGVNGEVAGHAFGRVKVNLEDGKTLTVEPDKIAAPVEKAPVEAEKPGKAILDRVPANVAAAQGLPDILALPASTLATAPKGLLAMHHDAATLGGRHVLIFDSRASAERYAKTLDTAATTYGLNEVGKLAMLNIRDLAGGTTATDAALGITYAGQPQAPTSQTNETAPAQTTQETPAETPSNAKPRPRNQKGRQGGQGNEALLAPPQTQATEPTTAAAEPTKAGGSDMDAGDQALADAFEGLYASERPAVTQIGLPSDRREAMMKAAATLVDLNLTAPSELVARLDKLAPNGALRQYAHSFWKVMQGFNDALEDVAKEDWNSIFNPQQATEGNRNTDIIRQAAERLKTGDKGTTTAVIPQVDAAPAATKETAPKPSQSITGSNAETPAEMPVRGEPTEASPGEAPATQAIRKGLEEVRGELQAARDALAAGFGDEDTPSEIASLERRERALAQKLRDAEKTPAPLDTAANEAATSPLNDRPEPTPAQKQAGNYKVGRVNVSGLDISIENPAGSERKGKDKSGKAWSITMADHYGYVRGSQGKDGDHIDIFIEPGTPLDYTGPVFVVNQLNQDEAFDEHKAVMGPSITTAETAETEYLKNYSPGWKGAGSVVKFDSVAAFKAWALEKQRRAPVRQETADTFNQSSRLPRAEGATGAVVEEAAAPAANSALVPEQHASAMRRLLRQKQAAMIAGNGDRVDDLEDKIEKLRAVIHGRPKVPTPANTPPASEMSPATNDAKPVPGATSGVLPANKEKYGYPWRGVASTNENGRLAVDAGGNTQDEAKANALALLSERWHAREKQFASKTLTPAQNIADFIKKQMLNGSVVNQRQLDNLLVQAGKIAPGFTRKDVDEAAELGITMAAREIVQQGGTPAEIYAKLTALYARQPKLGAKTSTSKINQAYSTPAPLAYLASRLADVAGGKIIAEPSAGNGMLLIEADPSKQAIEANEINADRRARLAAQGIEATGEDGVTWTPAKTPDRVIANPPFGQVMEEGGANRVFQTPAGDTTSIDHAIVLRSLETMAAEGRAVFIIGGPPPTVRTPQGRAAYYRAGKKGAFFAHLYQNNRVVDHFTIPGELYEKQGAGWPIDVIVVAGKGSPSALSLPGRKAPRIIETWEALANELDRTDTDRIEQGRLTEADVQRDADEMVAGLAGSSNLGGLAELSQRPRREQTATRPGQDVRAADTAGTESASRGSDKPRAVGLDERSANPSAGARSNEQGVASGVAGQPTEARASQSGPGEVGSEFQLAYSPASGVNPAGLLAPVNLATPMREALARLQSRVGDLPEYVRQKLGYPAGADISKYFFGDQIDALAQAIYNVENGGALVIGDQTGTGKGRIAAGLMKYAAKRGLTPVFFTKDPTLYDAMLDDLQDIGAPEIKPLITNNAWGEEYQDFKKRLKSAGIANGKEQFEEYIKTGELPAQSNAIFTSYSQIASDDQPGLTPAQRAQAKNSEEAPPAYWRMEALKKLAPNALMILDESHIASGASATGWRLAELLKACPNVYYSSATFAKRPDNMGLYFRTNLGQVSNDMQGLMKVMSDGGVPAMQVASSMLARDGQYMRRERSYAGVRFTTEINNGLYERDKALADNYTDGLRAIVFVQERMAKAAAAINKLVAAAGKNWDVPTGNRMNLESQNFSAKLHNMVRQYLFSIKAGTASQMAIKAIKEGAPDATGKVRPHKVIVAVENTMEGAIKELTERGFPLTFNGMLNMYLDQQREFTVKGGGFGKAKETWKLPKTGNPEFAKTDDTMLKRMLVTTGRHPATGEQTVDINQDALKELVWRAMNGAFVEAQDALEKLQLADMPLSPIDAMRQAVEAAGIRTGEMTARQFGIDSAGKMYERKEAGRMKAKEDFNNGDLHFLVINKSGSTGVSMHASEKFKDRRPRMMMVVQPNLDINEFMQTIGRIHRAGQVELPSYVMPQTALPAEKRPAAILGSKMAMLNANTTSNADSEVSQKDALDLFNKYGDEVTWNYLSKNPGLVKLLAQSWPKLTDNNGMLNTLNDFINGENGGEGYLSRSVTGHLAILPVEEQEAFWEAAEADYRALIDYLDAVGQNDLRATVVDMKAKTVDKILFSGGGDEARSVFGEPSWLETVETKMGRKPVEAAEVVAMAKEIKAGSKTQQAEFVQLADEFIDTEDKRKAVVQNKWESKRDEWLANQRAAKNLIASAIGKIGTFGAYERAEGTLGYAMLKSVSLNADKPTTPSLQMARLVLNDSRFEISVPLTQLDKFFSPITYGEAEQWAATYDYGSTRTIVTGNILAAIPMLEGKGQIVSFSTDSGENRMGILLPSGFTKDMQKKAESRDPVTTAERFIERLREGYTVANASNTVRFAGQDWTFFLYVPASRAAGGKYWRDPALNRLMRHGEFREIGGYMTGSLEPDKLAEVFNYLVASGETFSTAADKDENKPLAASDRPSLSPIQQAVGNTWSLPGDVLQRFKALVSPTEALRFGRLFAEAKARGEFEVKGGKVRLANSKAMLTSSPPAKPAAATTDAKATVLEAMRAVEATQLSNGMVPVHLIAAKSGLPLEQAKAALKALYDEGVISLSPHGYPNDMSTEERAAVVPGIYQGGSYATFMALGASERPGVDPDIEAALEELNGPPLTLEERQKVRERSGYDPAKDYTLEEAQQIAESIREGNRVGYQFERSPETHKGWQEEADKLRRELGLVGSLNHVLKARDAGELSGSLTKLGQMVLTELRTQAILQRDGRALSDAETLQQAMQRSATKAGQANAALWNPYQTPEEMHREILGKAIWALSAEGKARLERAKTRMEIKEAIAGMQKQIDETKATAAARERELLARGGELAGDLRQEIGKLKAAAARKIAALAKEIADLRAQKDAETIRAEEMTKRLAEVTKALEDMGLTLHDILVSKEAVARLRGNAIVKRALAPFTDKERLATKMRMEANTDAEIKAATGYTDAQLADAFKRTSEALSKAFEVFTKRGLSLNDFMVLDTAGNRFEPNSIITPTGGLAAANRATGVSDEQSAKALAEIMGALFPSDKARNKGALKRQRGRTDGRTPFVFDVSDPAHAAMVLRAIQRLDASGFDKVYEYWINGLLSGPATQVANVAGNTGAAALEYGIQRPMEALVNAVLFRDSRGAQFDEYRSMAKYVTRAFARAWGYAKQAWETEVSLFDNIHLGRSILLSGDADKGQVSRFAIKGEKGRFIRIPGRALQFADEFAKFFFGQLEAAAQAHRAAKAEGLSGAAFDAYVAAEINDARSASWERAANKAHAMTFTEDLPAGLQRVHNIMHDRAVTGSGAILKGFLKFVFPFVRTPYNIFKTGIRKTPLGSIRLATKVGAGLVDAWKGNQPFFKSYERAALAGDIAEQILGWGVALLLAGMAEGDPDDDKKALLITGTRSSTDNRGEDQLLKRTRGGETTILWHGKPVFNYGRIEPFSTVISTLVDAMRELKRIKGGEPATKAVEHAMRDLVDQARSKTFLSGLDGLMTLLNGQNKGLPDMAAKAIATGIVPNLVRQTLRNTDDRARDTRNAPLLYQALPWGGWAEPLFDLYGREIVKDGSAAYRVLANDGNAKIQPINPADVALERWNKATEGDPAQQYYPVNPSVFRTKGPDGNYRQMTPKEIAAFRKRAGQEFGAAARGNFANPTAPTLSEIRELRRLKDQTYDKTKKAMFPQPPSLASLFLRR